MPKSKELILFKDKQLLLSVVMGSKNFAFTLTTSIHNKPPMIIPIDQKQVLPLIKFFEDNGLCK